MARSNDNLETSSYETVFCKDSLTLIVLFIGKYADKSYILNILLLNITLFPIIMLCITHLNKFQNIYIFFSFRNSIHQKFYNKNLEINSTKYILIKPPKMKILHSK